MVVWIRTCAPKVVNARDIMVRIVLWHGVSRACGGGMPVWNRRRRGIHVVVRRQLITTNVHGSAGAKAKRFVRPELGIGFHESQVIVCRGYLCGFTRIQTQRPRR